MASYTHETARLTGPELNYDRPLTGPSLFGFELTSNNPWKDDENQRRLAKLMFGALGGGGLLSLGFKAQDYLNPWGDPAHKSEETKEKEKQADIDSRDDYPAIAKEKKRLYAIAMRLNRAADWDRLRSFNKYAW